MADQVKLKSKGVLLAKIQASVSVDPVPTPELNAIMVEDPVIESVIKKMVRNAAQPYMGKRLQVNIGESLKITFKTELKGSGTAGTAPETGVFFRSCNFTETVTPVTSVEYTPNSLVDSAEMCTIYFYLDGILHKALNCRGTFTVDAKAGEYGYISWEFMGIYAGPTRVTNPAPTLSAVFPPRLISASFAIDGVAAVIASIGITQGNEQAKRPDANAATGINQFIIKDRAMSGKIDPEIHALVAATLSTALAGDNNDLVFTAHANYPGVDGNAITVEYEDTAVAGAETCTVTGTSIVVGVEAGVSTSAQVKTKIEATPAAMALLASVANAPANDGSGVVPVMAEDNLEGGTGLDFWKRNEDSTLMPLTATLGATAGNICTISTSRVQIDDMKYAERDNILIADLTLNFVPSTAGNDEISYLFT